MTNRTRVMIVVLAALVASFGAAGALAQGPVPLAVQSLPGYGFVYQGRLVNNGVPVNGSCDIAFRLFDDPNTGAQAGPALTPIVQVAGGLFHTTLDFGANALNGEARWLDMQVRCPQGSGAFTQLAGRQPLAPTPYALALPGLRTVQHITAPSVIGGYWGNVVSPTAFGATIAGGGQGPTANPAFPNRVTANFGTVGGGVLNQAGDDAGSANSTHATVGGGSNNRATGFLSAVAGGGSNTAGGNSSFVGGGYFNQAGGGLSVLGGGWGNEASALYAIVAGGLRNKALAEHGVIGGGITNTVLVTGSYSVIAGGLRNTVGGLYATVGGGDTNRALGQWATVAGGNDNAASDVQAFVGGGEHNVSSGNNSVVAGGNGNFATAVGASIGGGDHNEARANDATVAGGYGNVVTATYGTVGGGFFNEATGIAAVVAGGERNAAADEHTFVGGGQNNRALDNFTTIVGGISNTIGAFADYGFVGGGQGNTVNNNFGVIGGGDRNTAGGYASTAAGGVQNLANANYATIGGGNTNTVTAYAGTVPGGERNLAGGQYSFAAGSQARALHDGSFVWADNQIAPFASSAAQQFRVRAGGGVYISVKDALGLTPAAVEISHTSANGVALFAQQTSSDATLVLSNRGTGDLIKAFGTSTAGNLRFRVDQLGNVTADGTITGGGADYAEWLPRADAAEAIAPGEIVGVTAGRVTKRTRGASQWMVASTAPAVAGGAPAEGADAAHTLIAFIGQVPVRVRGAVRSGDFIVPSGAEDGTGIAIAPERITAAQYAQAVGQAWEASAVEELKTVRVAVGLARTDPTVGRLVAHAQEQAEALAGLEARVTALEGAARGGALAIPGGDWLGGNALGAAALGVALLSGVRKAGRR